LTTFSQPIEAIARQAVAWLSQSGVAEGQSVTLQADLVWRDSVRGG